MSGKSRKIRNFCMANSPDTRLSPDVTGVGNKFAKPELFPTPVTSGEKFLTLRLFPDKAGLSSRIAIAPIAIAPIAIAQNFCHNDVFSWLVRRKVVKSGKSSWRDRSGEQLGFCKFVPHSWLVRRKVVKSAKSRKVRRSPDICNYYETIENFRSRQLYNSWTLCTAGRIRSVVHTQFIGGGIGNFHCPIIVVNIRRSPDFTTFFSWLVRRKVVKSAKKS